jgi:hypothetical protein
MEADFYIPPEIQSRVMDPDVMRLHPPDVHRGSSLLGLTAFGLTTDALDVMTEMLNITFLLEDYADGSLINLDILALTARRNQAHHRLLSLPTGAELSGSLKATTSFYECCRLAALMYATAVVFPLPRSTRLPQRLVVEIKRCVEHVSPEIVFGGARPFFIWVLMLTGTAAAGMSERAWFKEKLINILGLEGVSRWAELKKILFSFLWMDFVCAEGAMELWDEIVTILRKP